MPQQQPYPPQQDATFQGAPVPPPAPQKRVGKKLLGIGAVIVIAIAIALGKSYLSQTDADAETASVGSRMHNEGTMSEPDLKTVDCSSGDSEYQVVEKFDDTSDRSKCETVTDAEIAYYQIGDNHDVVLCLKEV